MIKYIKVLPFVLLLALTPFFFYSQPNLAQSIIILAIAGLCGHFYYIDSKQLPDYKSIFSNELSDIDNRIKSTRDADLELLRKELAIVHKDAKETREMVIKSNIQDIHKKTSNYIF